MQILNGNQKRQEMKMMPDFQLSQHRIQTHTHTDTLTHSHTHITTPRDTGSHTQTQMDTQKKTQTDTQSHTQTYTQTHTHTQTHTDTHTRPHTLISVEGDRNAHSHLDHHDQSTSPHPGGKKNLNTKICIWVTVWVDKSVCECGWVWVCVCV